MRGDVLWPKGYAVLQCAGPIKALLGFRIRPLGACPAYLPPYAQLAVALFVRIPRLYGRCAKNPAYNIQSALHIYKALLINAPSLPRMLRNPVLLAKPMLRISLSIGQAGSLAWLIDSDHGLVRNLHYANRTRAYTSA